MVDFEKIRESLKQSVIRDVAKDIGVHENTLYRIARGEHHNITVNVLNRIMEYFNDKDK